MVTAAIWLAWISLWGVVFYAIPDERELQPAWERTQSTILWFVIITSSAAAILATIAVNR